MSEVFLTERLVGTEKDGGGMSFVISLAAIFAWLPALVVFGPGAMAEDVFQPYRDSAGLVVRLSDESTKPLIPTGKHRWSDSENRAYPDVLSCLPHSERAKHQPDLTTFDFKTIGSRSAGEVCIHRIATSYASICDFESWMIKKDFTLLNETPGKCTRKTGISGHWDTREKGYLWGGCRICSFEDFMTEVDGIWIIFDHTGTDVVSVNVYTLD